MSGWAIAMWSTFLVGIAVVFVILERIAWKSGNTLSRYMFLMGRFKPAIFVWGMLVGGLVVHFWWNFCPAGSISVG